MLLPSSTPTLVELPFLFINHILLKTDRGLLYPVADRYVTHVVFVVSGHHSLLTSMELVTLPSHSCLPSGTSRCYNDFISVPVTFSGISLELLENAVGSVV